MTDLTPPETAIVAKAQEATPTSETFQPTEALTKLAAVLFEAHCDSWSELAKAAGISRVQLWRLANDPDSCAWLVGQSTKAAGALLGAVHARLAHLALTSKSPAALELFLKRFDPEYQKAAAIHVHGDINNDLKAVVNMSTEELQRFVALKLKATGHVSPRPEAAPV